MNALDQKLDQLFEEWYWCMMTGREWIANQILLEGNQLIEQLNKEAQ